MVPMARVVKAEYDSGELAGLELWVWDASGKRVDTPLYNKEWEGRMLPAPSPTALREERAKAIVATNGIRKNGSGWYVQSQSNPRVWYWTDGSKCTCPDYRKRGGPCKHALAVQQHLREQHEASTKTLAELSADIWG